MAYNPDGSRIASLVAWRMGAGTSRLWDATTGKEIAVLAEWQEGTRSGSPLAPMASGWPWVQGVRSPVRRRHRPAACRPGPSWKPVELAGLQSGWQADCVRDRCRFQRHSPLGWRERQRSRRVARPHGHVSASVLFSPDGSRLVSASNYPDNTARLWDAATGRLLAVLAGHKNSIMRGRLQPGRQADRHGLDGPDGAALGRRHGAVAGRPGRAYGPGDARPLQPERHARRHRLGRCDASALGRPDGRI